MDNLANTQELVEQAIRKFPFWNYGLDEVDPNDDFAEWVEDLAAAIATKLTA